MHSFAMYLALHALLSYVYGAVMHSFSMSLSLLGIHFRSKRQCHTVLSYLSGTLAMHFFLKCRGSDMHSWILRCCSLLFLYRVPSCTRHWHCHAFIPEVGITVMNLFHTDAVMHSFPRSWQRHAFLSAWLPPPCIPFLVAGTAIHSFPHSCHRHAFLSS